MLLSIVFKPARYLLLYNFFRFYSWGFFGDYSIHKFIALLCAGAYMGSESDGVILDVISNTAWKCLTIYSDLMDYLKSGCLYDNIFSLQ